MIEPKDNQTIYFVIQGQVNVIAEEKIFKKLMTEIRRVRKRRMMEQKLQEEEEEVENPFLEAVDQEDFVSDFPTEMIKKNEYERNKVGRTFGNDRPLTNVKFRPSFGMAEGISTTVLCLPLHAVQQALDNFNNSEENVAK